MTDMQLLIGLLIIAAMLLITAIKMVIRANDEIEAHKRLNAYLDADAKRAKLYNASVLDRSHN
jgi:hypothetical protein